MRPAYPWSAVVGQDAVKRALLLCAVDPTIGGVLVRGPRGVAKTTLARALAQLVPGRFVELPLGASEERVAGTLDLAAALEDGRVAFSPGLLAAAHDGVLYVDEINLLADPLVDLLLDAAATGHHFVERDGISHSHAARFVLVGTMNPDEGELRPQLVDRFGLCASAGSGLAPAERAEILALRLAFDRDPVAFVAERAAAQAELAARCAHARERLLDVQLAAHTLEHIGERCHAAGVEGVRADLAMLRAARAHAAWHERLEIEPGDIDAVADLALAHRRAPTPPPDPARAARPAPRPEPAPPTPPRGSEGPASGPRPRASSGDRGARPPVPVPVEHAAALPGWLTRSPRGALRPGARARRIGGGRERGPIDWFQTLRAQRPRRRQDLRFRRRRPQPARFLILALDCSASMLRGRALSAAKGIARNLATTAERQGRPVALIAFHGRAAELASADTHGLAGLGAGGGTPLRAALDQAIALCSERDSRAGSRLVLLTDGRSREDVSDLGAALRSRRVDTVVVDCERASVPLGRCAALARALGARLLKGTPP